MKPKERVEQTEGRATECEERGGKVRRGRMKIKGREG
jgi:hypothetical protein